MLSAQNSTFGNGMHEEAWVFPLNIKDWLPNPVVGFGMAKDEKLLWQNTVMAIMWVVCLEVYFRSCYFVCVILWGRAIF